MSFDGRSDLVRATGQGPGRRQAALDLMTELDTLSVDENQFRATLFKDREDKVAYLGLRLTGLRRIVTGHYADPDLERLGLAGRNARESIALLRQSELICERLSSENLAPVLGETLFEPPLDPRPYVQQVDSTLAELRAAFEAHQRARRRVDGILAACKRDLKLEPEIRRNLRSAATMLGKQPWRVHEILASLRRSYIVPVPGLLTDRVMAAAAVER